MKLPDQTKHGVTLSRIDYSPRLSEETPAFAAAIEFGGLKGDVRNAGQGGDNEIHPRALHDAIAAHCATLPLIPARYEWENGEASPVTYDCLIAGMIDDAIEANEDRKLARKGFTFKVTAGDRALYCVGEPREADFKRLAATPATATVKNIAHLAARA